MMYKNQTKNIRHIEKRRAWKQRGETCKTHDAKLTTAGTTATRLHLQILELHTKHINTQTSKKARRSTDETNKLKERKEPHENERYTRFVGELGAQVEGQGALKSKREARKETEQTASTGSVTLSVAKNAAESVVVLPIPLFP